MLEHPHHAVRILGENFRVRGIDPAFARDEAVELLALLFPKREERTQARFLARFLLDLESFHQRGRVPVEVARVAVVIPHEGLGRPQDALLRIGESGGDHALELERELVRGLAGVIVQLVADAVEEIVSRLDFAMGARGNEFRIDELLADCGCRASPARPSGCSDSRAGRRSFPSRSAPAGKPCAKIFRDECAGPSGADSKNASWPLRMHSFSKRRDELCRTSAMSPAISRESISEVLFSWSALACSMHSLHRTARMPDLEARHPTADRECPAPVPATASGSLVEARGRRNKDVDVRAAVQRAAAVSAGRDQRDRQDLACLRAFSEAAKMDLMIVSISAARARATFKTARTGAMVQQDAVLLDFQKSLVECDPFGWREAGLRERA